MGADESIEKRYLIDAGIPALEGKEGYYATYLSIKLQLARWLGGETGYATTDPRIYLYTELLISHITDEAERTRLRAKIEAEETRLLKDTKGEASSEERALARREACFIVQGDISTWYDKFVGVTSKNVIEMV